MSDAPFQLLGEDGVLVDGAQAPADLDGETLVALYTHMVRQRELDDLMLTLQRQGRIGFYGAASGQEAAVFGSGQALEERDWILPALREGGVALMRGYSLEDYLAQCFGNAADVTHGRQMPCHYGAKAQHFATLSSPIGTQLPHAVGVAWGMKLRKTDAVCAAYMGDGATSENDFHTSLDLAKRFQLPVVFICQNNQWAISVPVSGQTRAPSIAARAKAFDMPARRVDGNDILACYQAVKEAVDRARAGGGPTFLELLTYRMGAHSTSDDPSRYRDEGITEAWKQRDPITRFRAYLVAQGHLSDADADALTARLGIEIRETLSQVEAADPQPSLGSMFDDVFAERTWLLEEQAETAAQYPLTAPH
jgi:pyruvate dehydrogenase E1 component alpha subunit/2-oxoisovalerate dehydrogenase E1 component alpha subunit